MNSTDVLSRLRALEKAHQKLQEEAYTRIHQRPTLLDELSERITKLEVEKAELLKRVKKLEKGVLLNPLLVFLGSAAILALINWKRR